MLNNIIKLDPVEACGLLLGNDHIVTLVIPVKNILESPTRYKMDPQEQWDAFKLMEEQKLELLGIYHSHPNGPEIPSASDIAEAFYPEAIQLIWHKQDLNWYCRAFCIKSGSVTEAKLIISS